MQAAPPKGCHLLQQGFNQLGKVVPLPAFVTSCSSAEQIGRVCGENCAGSSPCTILVVVPAPSIQGRAGSGPPGQTPGLLSSAQSLAFHSVEFKFPSKLMLPEQHSPFLSPLPALSLPVKEGQGRGAGSGACPGRSSAAVLRKSLHFRWSLNLKASSSSNFETRLCDAAS